MLLLTKKQINDLITVKIKLENHWWTFHNAVVEAKKTGVDLDCSGERELIDSIDSTMHKAIREDPDFRSKMCSICEEIG